MSFRTVAIVLTSVTFVVTFALDSWRTGVWRRPVASGASAAIAPAVRAESATGNDPPAEAPPIAVASAAPSAPVVTAKATNNPLNLPVAGLDASLPIGLRIEGLKDQPGRAPILENTSSESETITVTVLQTDTGYTMSDTVTIRPHKLAYVSNMGLRVSVGDTLTIQSSDFPDQVIKVP